MTTLTTVLNGFMCYLKSIEVKYPNNLCSFQNEEVGMRQTVVGGLLRSLKDRCQSDPAFVAKADRADSIAKAIESSLWSFCGGGGKTYKNK